MDISSFELTLEQQFHMQLMQEAAHGMNQEQLSELLVQSVRLLMVKDNVIRSLMKHPAPCSVPPVSSLLTPDS